MTRKILSAAVSAALALGVAGLTPQAQASGFAVPELSAAGLSLSNALVANPEELGAIPYNAAAMGFQDKSSLSVGALFINFNLSVDTASGKHDSQSPDWVIPPLFQAVAKINEQWRVGLGVNAPFGLETRWEPGTFPALSGNQSPPFARAGTDALTHRQSAAPEQAPGPGYRPHRELQGQRELERLRWPGLLLDQGGRPQFLPGRA